MKKKKAAITKSTKKATRKPPSRTTQPENGAKRPKKSLSCSLQLRDQEILASERSRDLCATNSALSEDISERKRTEAALRQSEKFLQTVIESEPECVKLVGRDGALLMMNRAGLDMIQADSFEQVKGKPIGHFIPPTYQAAFSKINEKAFQGKSGTLTFEMTGFKGRRLWLTTRVVPLRNENDEVVAALGITRDVTEQKRVEESLRKESVFISAVLDTIGAIVLVLDREGKIIRFNHACENVSGYDFDEVKGRYVWDFLLPPEQIDPVKGVFKNLTAGRFPSHYENDWVAKNGERRLIAWSNTALLDENGGVEYVIATGIDITERKKTEEALRDREERYRLLFHRSPIGIFNYDRRLVITDCNESFIDILRSRRELLVGLDMDMLKDRRVLPALQAALHGEEGSYEGFYDVTTSSAEINVYMRTAPLYDPTGAVIGGVGIVEDITARKQAEQSLQNALQRAEEEKNKSEAIIAAIGDGICILDSDCRLLYQNQHHKTLLGDHLGEFCYEAFVHTGDTCETCPIIRSYQDGTVHTAEQCVRTARGDIYVEITSSPLRDSSGKMISGVEVVRDISERKRMEAALRESEDLFRSLTEKSLAGIYLIQGGLFRYINPRFAEIFQCGVDEVTDRLGPKDLTSPEDWPMVQDHLEKRLTGRAGSVHYFFRGLTKKGNSADIEVYGTATIFRGRPAIIGTLLDITERTRAEQVIRRNYDVQTTINWLLNISLKDVSLDGVLKQSLDLILSVPWLSFEVRGGIFLVEGDPGRLIMKAERGLSDHIRKDCAVVPFGTCLCGRAAARGEVQFADDLDDRHEVRCEGIAPHGHYCVPIKSGRTVLGVINIYLNAGHPWDLKEVEFLNAVASALAGIIQRKRVEEEREKLIEELRTVLAVVSRSQKEWRDTFDNIQDPIYIMDTEYRIIKANKAFVEFTGKSFHEVVDRKCYELLHAEGEPDQYCPYRELRATGKPADVELVDLKTKKTLVVSHFPYVTPDGAFGGSISIVRDVTEEREKEMRFIMNERLASLGQMAASIAHEINNPLTAIQGCAEGLLKRVSQERYDPILYKNYLQIIEEEIARCKNITTGMLSFVRRNAPEKKAVAVHETLDRTLEVIGLQGRLKEVEVVKRYGEGCRILHGNEGELKQVFLAVITNALDAMGDKGVLTIETGTDDGAARIAISDTGPGIPSEHINRIFEPFFTTKSELGGTGLGLAIARKILTNHSGGIHASTEIGKGTTFTVTLPIQKKSS